MAKRIRTPSEVDRLRAKQAKTVMPLIGGLLGAWEGVPNDFRAEIEEHATGLAEYLDEINAKMEDTR